MLDQSRDGNDTVSGRTTRLFIDINYLQLITSLQLILANTSQIFDGLHGARSGPGNIQPQLMRPHGLSRIEWTTIRAHKKLLPAIPLIERDARPIQPEHVPRWKDHPGSFAPAWGWCGPAWESPKSDRRPLIAAVAADR